MRALALLLTLAGFTLPALCAKRVTVAELEQTITAVQNLPDAEAAKQLSDLELTERLSTAQFDGLEKDLPGEKARQAFIVLADTSVFLEPPASEIPTQPAPDVATQRQILARTITYVSETIHQLPNFFATRITRSFEDMPAVQRPGAITAYGDASATAYLPIRQVNDSNVTVTFNNGREIVEKTKSDPRVRNLTTSGVFGPILGTVLVDAARSKLAWSHWDQGSTGLEAVFAYEVPKQNSHYTLTYDSTPANPQQCSIIPQTYSKLVAYHGEMAVDPATGTILRLVLLADTKPDEFTVKSGIEVEYGRVTIGGKEYFLPLRSVTSSIAHVLMTIGAEGDAACPSLSVTRGLQTSLNDVAFHDYHVFRGEARVLTGNEAAELKNQPEPARDESSPKQAPQSDTSPVPDAVAATDATHAPDAVRPASQPETKSADVAHAADAAIPAAPVEAAPPANSAEAASSVEPENSSPPPASPDTPVFHTTARQVLVDVLVDKKNGDPVSGLPQSDFSIGEDGKPQAIDFFEEHSATAPTAAIPSMPPLAPGAVTNVPTGAPSAALYAFLLDSLNSERQDQLFVREQILTFLHKLEPGTQVAVFSLGSSLRLLQGFTSDRTLLLAAVNRKQAERDPMAQTRSDDADDAEHSAHLAAMQSASGQVGQYSRGDTVQAYSFGARASMTFEALNALARYLEGVPGRKNLIWFASSFPVILFPTPSEMEQLKSNPNLPGYVNRVQQTANLFTLSKIAVYPVSGAGVMNSNIGLADSPDAGSAGGTGHFGTASNPTSSLSSEALGSGSATATMEQLAASTGGRAFTTNDVDSALRRIVHDSDVYYTVGYSPSNAAMDGSFRRIDVKVTGGKYKLAYRQGYNAADPAAAPAENPMASLLLFGMPNATGILYAVGVTPAAQAATAESEPAGQNPALKGPLARYTISFTIRAQDISFGQGPDDSRIAKLLVGIKAYAANGAALNWQATREAVRLDAARYQAALQSGIPVTLDLDLPAATPAQIVTAVYDWNSSRAGSLQTALRR